MDLCVGAPVWLKEPLHGLRAGVTRRVTWVDSASRMKSGRNSASWKNNSASLLKVVLDSASLFLDSASQVAKTLTLRVETRISESSGDSVSWTGQDSEIGRLGESWTDSASRVANGRTLNL